MPTSTAVPTTPANGVDERQPAPSARTEPDADRIRLMRLVKIQVGQQKQRHHNQAGNDDGDNNRVEMQQQFLKAQEIPRGFRRIRRLRRIRSFAKRRVHASCPRDQQRQHDQPDDQLQIDQMRDRRDAHQFLRVRRRIIDAARDREGIFADTPGVIRRQNAHQQRKNDDVKGEERSQRDRANLLPAEQPGFQAIAYHRDIAEHLVTIVVAQYAN